MRDAPASLQRSFRRMATVACLLLLGCPDHPDRARLEAIQSFERIVPGMVTQMRDTLFPGDKGQPLGEKAALPTQCLKNLDYRVEPTSATEYPFLALLEVEMEGIPFEPGPVGVAARLERRFLISMDFVQTREVWRLYYSRVLSPIGLPASGDAEGVGDPMRPFKELLESWKESVRVSE